MAKCFTLLSMTMGVVCGELITRLVLGFESLIKSLCGPKKSTMKVIMKNLWLCMADKNGQIWKVANVLTKLRLYHSIAVNSGGRDCSFNLFQSQ